MKGSNKIHLHPLTCRSFPVLLLHLLSVSDHESLRSSFSRDSFWQPGRTTFNKWMFPEMGVFPNHPFKWDFPLSFCKPQIGELRNLIPGLKAMSNGPEMKRAQLECTASSNVGFTWIQCVGKTLYKWEITVKSDATLTAWLASKDIKTLEQGTLSSSVSLEPDLAPYKTASLDHPNTIQYHLYVRQHSTTRYNTIRYIQYNVVI